MPSSFCLTVRFLDPQPSFHGRGDGDIPEWPPSPLRLFQALVAAAAARWRDDQISLARSALEWLETQVPTIVAANIQQRRSLFRMYVPHNAGDLMLADWARGNSDASMAGHRVEKDVTPTRLQTGDAVHYLWDLPDPLPAEVGDLLEILSAAARSMTHLGWGVDMLAANGSVMPTGDAAQLPGERWLPAANLSGVQSRVPVRGTLDALIRRHQARLRRIERDPSGRERFHPVPPLTAFRTVAYRRASDSLARPAVVFQLRQEDGSFFRHAPARLIHIAGMTRHLAKNAMLTLPPRGVAENWVETFVMGHALPGKSEHRQLSYLPLPSIGHAHADHFVRRIMISAPIGDDEVLDHLAKILDGQRLRPEQQHVLAADAFLIRVQEDDVANYYVRPSNTWASVTPVILPGHADGKPAKTRKLIEKALTQSGIEQPCEFEWSPFSYFSKSLPAYQANKGQRPKGYFRPDHLLGLSSVHLQLRFHNDLQVPGPLMIGAGRHCGLGLMAMSTVEKPS
ncbi:type I-G CRISPR-associated protein Csb2 [Planctomicrobium sp. SH664]|uniref:type I-G CRISPR-associated protein Csb2 n=1 Tax=Planctomicrobium sp. SH664 TaxID=3448125 RepID=UPI003F5B3469